MKRLALLIAAVCLLVTGCDAFPQGSSVPPTSSQQPRLYPPSEMSELRVEVERADDNVTLAQASLDQGCPPNWRDQPNPDIDLCEPMKAHGQLVREVLDAENACREVVEEYNAQVRRGAPNEGGEIVLGSTKNANGKVISCRAA